MSYHPAAASRPIGAAQNENSTAVAMAGVVITGAMMTLAYFALRPRKGRRR